MNARNSHRLFRGVLPPYGPVNQAGLTANIGIAAQPFCKVPILPAKPQC